MNAPPKQSGPSIRAIPEGDTRERLICGDCGFVHYDNPKIVVGAVVLWGERILLCKRAIEPAYGRWTIPAGYMELGESPEEGAAREAFEEACAKIEIGALIGVYSVSRIGQVQMIYRAKLIDGEFAAGTESLETKLCAWDEIPWSEIAFPTVRLALDDWRATKDQNPVVPNLKRF
ncbi:MAG: NUDIX hydrolase [Tagaea sp. CACIAM 22H2]|nr:NUDIX hydrolase [Tagaea sp. CACIAM 22H2]